MKKLIEIIDSIKIWFWTVSILFWNKLLIAQSTGKNPLDDVKVGEIPSDGKNTGIVMDMVRAIIYDFDITAAFYDVMCWLCLFITAALGIKQLFVKSDEDRGGGFWNVLKVAGWGIAGLLGIIVKNTIGKS